MAVQHFDDSLLQPLTSSLLKSARSKILQPQITAISALFKVIHTLTTHNETNSYIGIILRSLIFLHIELSTSDTPIMLRDHITHNITSLLEDTQINTSLPIGEVLSPILKHLKPTR